MVTCQNNLLRLLGAAAFLAMSALLVVGLSPAPVRAHAVPERGSPPIDGVVSSQPEIVEVWFTEEVVPDETTLVVLSGDGQPVDLGDSEVDLLDPERRHVTVSLEPDLAPGRYLVQWESRSAIDDDQVNGSYRFTFDPSATPEAATPAASPTAAAAATVTPVPPPAAGSEAGDDEVDWTLLIAVAAVVAVVLGFTLMLMRHRRESSDETL